MTQQSLANMGKQYKAEVDNLDSMIESCKQRKMFAMRGGNHQEATRQERLIELHMQQRNDLLRLSVWLRNYYEKGTEAYHITKEETSHENHQSCAA
ncbi:MAG: hypothetical protein FWD06_00430 [Oscillospiraceae bacterium]|nr:hypothetical protein [Oscillospiraceae bacterium]